MDNYFHFDSLVWHWPIAIYLFAVGISSGMVLMAIIIKRWVVSDPAQSASVMKATAITAPLMLFIGLGILVFDLAKPLSFWRVMVFYNPTSIMSMGVALFQVYSIVLFLWIFSTYQQAFSSFGERIFGQHSKAQRFYLSLLNTAAGFGKKMDLVLFFLAILLGVYTGFLLSALKSFPMLNNPLLPVLFLNSGVLSGIAMLLMICIGIFKEPIHSVPMKFVHKIELPLILFEGLLLISFFTGLYFGGGQKIVASISALSGFWGSVFWLGVVGLGIILPLLVTRLPAGKQNKPVILTMSAIALLSVLTLRVFILYAGQLTIA